MTQPESGITAYGSFTVAGKPMVTNYNGRTVTMAPDWMGRPLGVISSNPGDSSLAQTFTYDTAPGGKGRVACATDGSVATTYSYNALGGRLDSLITAVQVQGSPQSFTQSFTYDSFGNRTSGYTSHDTWTQTYTPETGLPNLLSYGSTGTVASTPWASYDPTSWMLKLISYGNGVKTSFSYDADQARLTQIIHSPASGGPFAQWVYHYDGCGNMLEEDDVLTGSFDQFGYDGLNRLQSALVASPTYGDQLQQFTYDAFGNRTSSLIQKVTGWSAGRGALGSVAYVTSSPLLIDPNRHVVNAAFDPSLTALNNQLPAQTSAGAPTGAIYDAQGNLTQVYMMPGDTTTQLTMIYDALGRVIQVGNSKSNLVEKYQYTAEGLRTIVQVYDSDNLQTTRVNLYDDRRQLVAQYEKAAGGSLTWKRDIVYLGTREAAEFDSVGMHVTQVDHLGSPRVVTGPTGTLESTQKYLPFGELLEQNNVVPTAIKIAKGYTNHEQTDPSGLIYMQARFYIPWFGRFASPDPARDQHFEDTQSWNIYSYVRNSPIMSTDPTGMVDAPKSIESIMGSPGIPDPTTALEHDTAKRIAEHALTNSNTGNYSLTSGYLGDVAGKPGTPIPSGPDPKLTPAKLDGSSNLTVGIGIEYEAGFGKTDTHGVSAASLSFTSSGFDHGELHYPNGISGQITSSDPAPATVYGAAYSLGKNVTVGNAGGGTDFKGVTHNTSLTLGIFQVTYGKSDSGVKQYSFGLAIGLSFSRYDTRTLSGGFGADNAH